MNKKGDYKWGIILSLILGLMVLSLSLYFIFNELWTDADVDRQVCRQSIQLRSLLPDARIKGIANIGSFKDEFPLKCKTHIVEINENDVKNIDKAKVIIAETMAECWALYDKGDTSAFPAKFWSNIGSTCVPCARIHLTDEAKEYLRDNSKVEIDIRNALDERMEKEFTYYTYLKESGKKFSAFDLAKSGEFNFGGDKFKVDDENKVGAVFYNKLTGGKDDGVLIEDVFNLFDVSPVSLPKIFDPEKGDLLINYGIVTSSSEGAIGNYIPYLFYFQTEDSDSFEEVKKQLFDGAWWKNSDFCNEWEGIPA